MSAVFFEHLSVHEEIPMTDRTIVMLDKITKSYAGHTAVHELELKVPNPV